MCSQVQGLASAPRSAQFVLEAIDEFGARSTVEEVTLVFQFRDTAVPAYGPNGRGCVNGVADDGEEMDTRFTCDCTATRFTGSNCETEPNSAQTGSATTSAVIGVLSCIVAIAVLAGFATKYRSHQRANAATDFETKLQVFNAELQALKDQGSVEPERPAKERVPRELKRGWLTTTDRLGHGKFGEVWKGLLADAENAANVPEYLVAIKVVLRPSGRQDTLCAAAAAAEDELLDEAFLMAQVESHKHLVSLVGVVTRGHPKMLVLSFCEHGELQGMLKKRAGDGNAFDMFTKYRFCAEIAAGMSVLAGNQFVHRDLAARNVLVASGVICKVADFGMSRQVQTDDNAGDYYRSTNGMIPVRWTAPEGLNEQKYSSASDVWSFGITCMEIFQDAVAPYTGVTSNPAVIAMVSAGGVHPQPAGCTDQVYAKLVRCFSFEPAGRPDFPSLQAFFARIAQKDNSLAARDTGSVLLFPELLEQNSYAAVGDVGLGFPNSMNIDGQPPTLAQQLIPNSAYASESGAGSRVLVNTGPFAPRPSLAAWAFGFNSSDVGVVPVDACQSSSSRSSVVNMKAGFSAQAQPSQLTSTGSVLSDDHDWYSPFSLPADVASKSERGATGGADNGSKDTRQKRGSCGRPKRMESINAGTSCAVSQPQPMDSRIQGTAAAAEARRANNPTLAEQHGAASNAANQYVECGYGTTSANSGGKQHSMENVYIATGSGDSPSSERRLSAMRNRIGIDEPVTHTDENGAHVASGGTDVAGTTRQVESLGAHTEAEAPNSQLGDNDSIDGDARPFRLSSFREVSTVIDAVSESDDTVLIQLSRNTRGKLGFAIKSVDSTQVTTNADTPGLPTVISNVHSDSVFYSTKLEVGDVLLEVDGASIVKMTHREKLNALGLCGDRVVLLVRREKLAYTYTQQVTVHRGIGERLGLDIAERQVSTV